MAQVTPEYPKIEPSDPEGVVVALQRANVLLRQGEVPEAVRWIRRAAEQAERDGNDARAVQLARMAADFAMPLAPSFRPSSLSPASDDEAAALSAFDDYSDQTVVDAPDAAVAREALRSRVQIHEASELEASAPTTRSLSTPASLPGALARSTETRPRQALRVAVARTRDADGSLRVIPLKDGAPPPPDTIEAMLVPLAADADLLGR